MVEIMCFAKMEGDKVIQKLASSPLRCEFTLRTDHPTLLTNSLSFMLG